MIGSRVCVALVLLLAMCSARADYDLVIEGGRVIDPASGTDKVLNVGVTDGTIVTLSEQPLPGKRVINAHRRIVAPGFIDLHTHTPFPYGEKLQVKDGVTTALDLEAGAFPLSFYGEFIRDQAHANYGASVGHYAIRIKVIEGKDQPYLLSKTGQMVPAEAFTQEATTAQVAAMRELIQQGLNQGGLGIGLLLDYMSDAVSDEELRMIFDVARANDSVVWAHLRRGVNGDIAPLHDMLELAVATGTKLHICHINANAMGAIEDWLAAIDKANARGASVTTEIYPYTAGSTSIMADVFSRDWQTIFGITYEDVQWSETGEYFTRETWERTRKERPDSSVIHHYMKEEWLAQALQYPYMMVSTDAMPSLQFEIKSAPNGAGSFTRLLAHFVRDEGVIELSDAIARASFYPARRLASFAPAFERKGRVQEGADADLLVFALENLQDNARYTDPYREATGWDYIIVGGKVVVEGGDLTGATPGRSVLNSK